MAKVYTRKHKTKTTYYAHFSLRGERHRIRLEAQNLAQAKQLAADVEYQFLTDAYRVLNKKKKKLREIADEYIEFAKTQKRSWDRDVVSLRNILHMEIGGKKLGDYDIDNVKVADVQKYQIRRKRELDDKHRDKGIEEKDRNYATVNRELACLKHIFYMAIEWEYVNRNPVVSKSIKFDKEKVRKRTLSDDEYHALLNKTSDHLNIIIKIALNTGMRLGEILKLSWADVDLEAMKIIIKHTKNDEDREIPINDFLLCEFNKIPGKEGYLFTNRDGKPMKSIKTTWNTAKRKLGISDLRFHDLRHTAATRMAKAKATESVIALILGHKRGSMTSRYINPHWDEMEEAVDALGKICHGFVTQANIKDIGVGGKFLFNNKVRDAV